MEPNRPKHQSMKQVKDRIARKVETVLLDQYYTLPYKLLSLEVHEGMIPDMRWNVYTDIGKKDIRKWER